VVTFAGMAPPLEAARSLPLTYIIERAVAQT
jgi:hypothetical protein